MKLESFCQIIIDYYHESKRDMPWRTAESDGTFDPYKIVVSELMLQQTQVSRVLAKYPEFIMQFPSVEILAQSELSKVLVAWQGLGYYRRAKFLHQTAQKVMEDYAGKFPRAAQDLVGLPGIGANTAGAILAYAYNEPVVFIETNIRSVFLHHFFAGQNEVIDSKILPLVEESLRQVGDRLSPREWYWALMDYGSHLKSVQPNPSVRSKHHVKQSKFSGSRRQVRGGIIRVLTQSPASLKELTSIINDDRLGAVLEDLAKEQLIYQVAGRYFLGSGILSK